MKIRVVEVKHISLGVDTPADAKAVAEAGAFAVVLEAMTEPLAAKITREIGANEIASENGLLRS